MKRIVPNQELDALPRCAMMPSEQWRDRVRTLAAESPVRDLVSCGLQARLELSGELARVRARIEAASAEESAQWRVWERDTRIRYRL